MRAYQLLIILSYLALNTSLAQIQIGQDIIGGAIFDQCGNSVSFSADGLRIAVAAEGEGGISGHVRIFQNVNGTWTQIGQEIVGEDVNDNSGRSISLSADGKRIAIGANNNDGNGYDSGHVRIYQEVSGTWIQVGQDIDGEASLDASGFSVSISSDGSRVAIGAHLNDGNGPESGHVRVFQENQGTWIQIGQDINGEAADDKFGGSVSISSNGKIVAIAGNWNDGNGPNSGHVRVFKENQGTWTQVGQDIDGEAAEDNFGSSVSISADGSRVVIGGSGNDEVGVNAGHVRVFEEVQGSWVQVGQDIDGEAALDMLGWSVSISANGKKIAIGAPRNDGNGSESGHTRIYQEENGNWMKIGENMNGKAAYSYSGYSVALSANGTKVIIGAPVYNTSQGMAMVYDLTGVSGRIYLDNNNNCIHETSEIGIANIPLLIQPGNYITQTDAEGRWQLDLPVNTYSIAVDTTGNWQTACSLPQNFTVIQVDSLTIAPAIGLSAKYPCPSPAVSINMPFMRPCFTNQFIYIQACNTNQATATLHNVTVVVTLDTFLQPTSFQLPYINLGNNSYEFNLSPLLPGQCTDFWIAATLDCNAQLGQGLCMQAEISPVEPCVLDSIPNPFPPIIQACPGEWDESSLAVTGYCQNDSIYFEITNKGVGDMTCYSPVVVYIDGVLHLIDSVKLDVQQIAVFVFPGNGESWHLQVAQHPNHPGNSNPNATVENCGGLTLPTNINLFAHDDADSFIDIYCDEVTGSYDPNDKTGFPLGVTTAHYIEANQQLEYRIRFQNTGTDTAFTVVIRDTLETDLDIFSVRSGVSSHAYEFRMHGQRVLEWTFNDIMLPDSNVNEPASHGFVSFVVDQVPDLPEGTLINNSAGIYFDFNEPIITNVTQHEVHYEFPNPVNLEEIAGSRKFALYPNPTTGDFYIDLKENYQEVNLTISDVTGRLIMNQKYKNVAGIPLKLEASKGIYFVHINTNTADHEVFKLITY